MGEPHIANMRHHILLAVFFCTHICAKYTFAKPWGTIMRGVNLEQIWAVVGSSTLLNPR